MITAPNEAKSATAGAAASEIAMTMTVKRQYKLTAVAAIWFRIVKEGEAVAVASKAGDNCHYIPAGGSFDVAPIGDRARISIIRDSATTDTTAILSEIATIVSV